MKLLRTEEREAHVAHISAEGAKGFFYGSLISLGLFSFLRTSYPHRFRQMNASVKSCILVMPTIATVAFFADQGSVDFDKEIHSSKENEERLLAEFRLWNNKSSWEKFMGAMCNNKFKVLTTGWLVSSYGSWTYFQRNKALAESQRLLMGKRCVQGISATAFLMAASFYYRDRSSRKNRLQE